MQCGTTISFTVTGQVNAAFGFLDPVATQYSFDIARIVSANGNVQIAQFRCETDGPRIAFMQEDVEVDSQPFSENEWSLSAELDQFITIVVPLVDIMYDTQFSDEDALEGDPQFLL